MKKLIDFDGLFEKKLKEYMAENAGKYTEQQWESLIPKLYKNFGDTFIKSAGNTPKGYYAEMTDDELVASLSAHFREGIPVSDFLCRELESRNCPEGLLVLMQDSDERLAEMAVDLAGDSAKAFSVYFQMLKKGTKAKELIVERLLNNADAVKEFALGLYAEGIERESMLELLSRCSEKDEHIFDILMKEFRTAAENLPMYAGYLAAYGDERALPVLYVYIDREEINYLEYQELKYAIEALGGEYTRERDFSNDPYYLEISEQSQSLPDFMKDKKSEA